MCVHGINSLWYFSDNLLQLKHCFFGFFCIKKRKGCKVKKYLKWTQSLLFLKPNKMEPGRQTLSTSSLRHFHIYEIWHDQKYTKVTLGNWCQGLRQWLVSEFDWRTVLQKPNRSPAHPSPPFPLEVWGRGSCPLSFHRLKYTKICVFLCVEIRHIEGC